VQLADDDSLGSGDDKSPILRPLLANANLTGLANRAASRRYNSSVTSRPY